MRGCDYLLDGADPGMVAIRAARWVLALLRYTLEEIDDPGLQRVFGTDDQKSIVLDVFLEDVRSPPQLVGGSTNVGSNGVLRQCIVVVSEFWRQQFLDRWPNAVDDRTQIARLVFCRPPKFFQGCLDSPALSVAQNYDEPCPEPLRGEFDAADLRRSDDVAGNTDHEQVTKALIKDDLYGHPGVRTAENDGKRFLANCRLTSMLLIHEGVRVATV